MPTTYYLTISMKTIVIIFAKMFAISGMWGQIAYAAAVHSTRQNPPDYYFGAGSMYSG